MNQKLILLVGVACLLVLVVGYVSLNFGELASAPEVNTNDEIPSETENTEPEIPTTDVNDFSSVVSVTLNSNSISADNKAGVEIDKTTLTITSAGNYSISGTLDDGQIIVDTNDNETVTLVLDGATISSSVGAPIFVEDAKNTVIVLAYDTQNFLTDSQNNGDNGTLCSKDNLVICGSGALTVTGNVNDAIRSNDGLVIEDGTITVTSVDDGIRGKDYLIINGGTINVNSVGDGLTSDNDEDPNLGYVSITGGEITVFSNEGDAISAQTDLTITGGTFQLTSGGGSNSALNPNVSTKGLKAGVNLVVDDGTFTINSSDDSIHSDGLIALAGGDFELSSGDDGLFAVVSITLEGGTFELTKSYEGMEAAEITINNSKVAITSSEDGISGTDFLLISGSEVTIVSVGDGLKSDNTEDTNKGYITIEDSTLQVTSTQGDAITAQTDLLITNGTFTLTSGGGSTVFPNDNLSTKGLKAGVNLAIEDGDFSINSSDDAIHSNDVIVIHSGTFNLASGDDAVHADTSLEINDGTFDISQSYEGLESTTITINGGNIQLVSSDDGINVAGGNTGNEDFGGWPRWGGGGGFEQPGDYYIYINGGTIYIDSGGDGLDSDGYIEMTGGLVIINGPTSNMNGAIDYGGGTFQLSGGTILAVGAAGMAQAPSSTNQNVASLRFSSVMSGDVLVNIQNESGENVLTFNPAKTYQSLVYTSPDLEAGTYSVYIGGTCTGTETYGLYEGGTYSGGTEYGSFTVS